MVKQQKELLKSCWKDCSRRNGLILILSKITCPTQKLKRKQEPLDSRAFEIDMSRV